jgi:putative transposase
MTVHDYAAGYLQEYVGIKDHGPKCTSSVLISVVFFAAAWTTSLTNACKRLRRAPSDQAARNALDAMLPEMPELEARFNRAFSAQAHKSLGKRPQSIAIDLVQNPYYGNPCEDDRELRRGEAKLGTTRFHTYATAYLISHGRRFTLAMTYVWKDDALEDVVQRLLEKVRKMGIRVGRLLLDREFYTLDVIRSLKAAHCPFLMPVVRRGRKPKDPSTSQGPWRFFTWNRSGWDTHTIRRDDQQVEVRICVAVHDSTSRRGRRTRQTLVYAFGGFEPSSPRWVSRRWTEGNSAPTTMRGSIRTGAMGSPAGWRR